MTLPLRKRRIWMYLGLLVLHIAAIWSDEPVFVACTKLALMPALWLLTKLELGAVQPLWSLAIFTSCLGDLFLLPSWRAEVFFMLGMGAFFVAQICYVSLLRMRETQLSSWAVGSIIAVIAGLQWGLSKTAAAAALRIGIGVYATALLAVFFLGLTPKHSRSRWVLWGAALFVLSDALIAGRMFVFAAEHARLVSTLVMLTYGLAQLGLSDLGRKSDLHKVERNAVGIPAY